MKNKTFPSFSGGYKGYNQLQEVHMGEGCFSTDEKPFLATIGLSSCIGIVVYDDNRKIAFLAHSTPYSLRPLRQREKEKQCNLEENTHVSQLYQELLKKGGKFDLEIVLALGDPPYDERNLLTIENDFKKIQKNPNISILDMERLEIPEYKSIGVDSRTGGLFSYDHRRNPNSVWTNNRTKKVVRSQ